MTETLVVNEIYSSLQGESTFAGLPCIFVRLTACNLRCSYCDTAYAFTEGKKMLLADILQEINRQSVCYQGRSASGMRLPLVELTGGEPLLQPNAIPLMQQLCEAGFIVLLETSGAHDISKVDARVHRIMDLKCPSSGEVDRNRWENILFLKKEDELKFVIGTVEDYLWAKEVLREHRLADICPILFSWVAPLTEAQRHPSLRKVPPGQTPLTRKELAERIIEDALPVRFQVQMHKVIWPADARGV
jgi:7-carboxy-7-deazaguanine synthase